MPKMVKLPEGVRFITHAHDVHEGRVTVCVFGWDGAGKSYLLSSETVDVPAPNPVLPRFTNLVFGEPWTPPRGGGY